VGARGVFSAQALKCLSLYLEVEGEGRGWPAAPLLSAAHAEVPRSCSFCATGIENPSCILHTLGSLDRDSIFWVLVPVTGWGAVRPMQARADGGRSG